MSGNFTVKLLVIVLKGFVRGWLKIWCLASGAKLSGNISCLYTSYETEYVTLSLMFRTLSVLLSEAIHVEETAADCRKYIISTSAQKKASCSLDCERWHEVVLSFFSLNLFKYFFLLYMAAIFCCISIIYVKFSGCMVDFTVFCWMNVDGQMLGFFLTVSSIDKKQENWNWLTWFFFFSFLYYKIQ